ncbi:phenylalanyl-tRNA synthetase beta subunit [Quadrisphaera granulorum]|uniref:Phenylalanine--tRNA ligase beta subunit n=1 Tax=Quadrisphaera granulorum TaxID=317664 RepID=A0A316A0G4_9ACTN|nr:phenylalanine--tRNA ligase subunit beta [Quadrisphaera granulorum]PWJ50204.1 phenylalanyl-tRNA synthetase beta subunit [Quadrisphaera granulorum]SZE97970.1 phenylalanyl-tRNA synthetase beta subunit [Quadrisphaera granulorum]
MRAPLSWLREWVDLPADVTGEQVAAALVRVGLEEEGLHGGDVTGPVVVGRVLSVSPEPQKNGKTINWCSVDTGEVARGEEPRGVVCGAHNFSAGDLVVVATPGAVLPGPFPIAARKTYGHVSDGMICSARELGLGEDHAGIIVLARLLGETAASQLEPGQDALALLGLTEEVVEVNVTPDRGYCFSVRGLAREYAHGARLDVATAFRDPAAVDVPAAGGSGAAAGHGVELRDDAPIHGAPGCTRFVTRVVRGVDPTAPSPFWLQRRLQQAGMRPISLAVDITNHVMLELGQPLHAYDLAEVDGPLVVRRARPGERLVTLDGVDRTLDPEDLLIADGTGVDGVGGARAIGLAGVMGGRDTEVTMTTRDVLVEAARFDPVTIARTARRHKLPSEASRRFERGVDTALQAAAAELAVRLLVEHGGGTADDAATDVVAPGTSLEPAPIALPVGLSAQLSGVPADQLDEARVVELLEQIGCSVAPSDDEALGTLDVVPPTWRPDLAQPVDLVEEVVRLHGYEAIPSVLPPAPPGRGLTSAQRLRRRAADALAAGGFVEVRSYPFTSAARSDELGLDADDPRRTALRLANPLSDEQPLLRTSVLATLLDVLRRNTSRGATDVALFEVGGVVNPVPGAPAAPRLRVDQRPSDAELAGLLAAVPPQPVHVAGVLAGRAEPEGWWGPGRTADAADAVAAAQTVAGALRLDLVVTAGALAPWHPGRCAQLSLPAPGPDGDEGAAAGTGAVVGHAGELHPAVVAALGLPPRTVAFELDLDALVAAAPELVPAPRLSPFPPSKEDVALIVDASVPAEAVRQALLAGAAGGGHADLVEEVRLFDVYTGAPVPAGQRSLAFSLRLRALDRTLTAADAAAVREAAVAEAARRHGAVLRGA